MGNEQIQNRRHDTIYYINSVIGILIMVFFQYLPAPAPITPAGMAILGQMIGLIYLWTFVDLVWPAFLGIIMFGFYAMTIYPSSWQLSGVYEAGMESFGSWIALFALGCMILSVALEEVGTIRRITMWFITRKFAQKSPWAFSFMFLLATFIIGAFMDCVAAQFFMFGIAHEIFDQMGFKKGDAWPRYMITATTFTIIITFAMTPICHTTSILWMGIYSGITGTPANILSYMAVGVPIGIVLFALMLVWFRFACKIDISQFQQIDFKELESRRPGPMGIKEKIVSIVCLVVLVLWLLPGFLGVFAPQSPINTFLNSITATTPLFLAIALLAVIHVDGKPVLDMNTALKKVDWGTYLFLGSMMMIATSLGEDTTGISGFIANNIVPLANGMTPYAVVALIAVLSCLVTNVANNIPVGIIFVSVGVPMALSMNFNPYLIVVAICLGANLAYTIPPAFVPVGVAYADPYCRGITVLKNGIAMTVISCAVLALLVYPLGVLFLG